MGENVTFSSFYNLCTLHVSVVVAKSRWGLVLETVYIVNIHVSIHVHVHVHVHVCHADSQDTG